MGMKTQILIAVLVMLLISTIAVAINQSFVTTRNAGKHMGKTSINGSYKEHPVSLVSKNKIKTTLFDINKLRNTRISAGKYYIEPLTMDRSKKLVNSILTAIYGPDARIEAQINDTGQNDEAIDLIYHVTLPGNTFTLTATIYRNLPIITIYSGDPARPMSQGGNCEAAKSKLDLLVKALSSTLPSIIGVDKLVVEKPQESYMYKALTHGEKWRSYNVSFQMLYCKLRFYINNLPVYGPLGRVVVSTNGNDYLLIIPRVRFVKTSMTIQISGERALKNFLSGRYLDNMEYFAGGTIIIAKYWIGYYADFQYVGGELPPAVLFKVYDEYNQSWIVPVRG